MALIHCPECGKKVSDQAPACIGCGQPLAPLAIATAAPPPKKSGRGWFKWIIWGVVGCVIGLVVFGLVRDRGYEKKIVGTWAGTNSFSLADLGVKGPKLTFTSISSQTYTEDGKVVSQGRLTIKDEKGQRLKFQETDTSKWDVSGGKLAITPVNVRITPIDQKTKELLDEYPSIRKYIRATEQDREKSKTKIVVLTDRQMVLEYDLEKWSTEPIRFKYTRVK